MVGTTDLEQALELEDIFDELYKLELEDDLLISKKVREVYQSARPPEMDRRLYLRELLKLQLELIKLQDWVEATGERVCVLFEDRDSAGKGGVIKRITQRLNPRICRVVALNKPSEKERTQWYFQRYVDHLPSGGEIVLFDRSWYNPAGVTGIGRQQQILMNQALFAANRLWSRFSQSCYKRFSHCRNRED
jgi:polyphosphate kinase 2 (PPK2 family)